MPLLCVKGSKDTNMHQAHIVTTPGFTPSIPSVFSMAPAPEGTNLMASTISYALPDKLWLLGGGRHRSTRALRRENRFKRRAFMLGGLSIRPNRRVDVTPKFIADHLEEIVTKVEQGVLLVQHHADSFVDADELRAITALVRGEKPVSPVVKSESKPVVVMPPPDDEDEEEDRETEDWDSTAGDGLHAGPGDDETPVDAPEAPAEPVEAPSEPQELPTDPLGGDQEPGSFAPTDIDLTEAPVEAPVQAAPIELPTTEPSDLSETDPEAAEDAKEKRWLPYGWRTMQKADLLDLCKKVGIQVDNKTANKKLIDLLDAWVKG